MRKIKFRGKCLDNGKFVYGYLWHADTFGATVNGVIVDPKSIAQLIGYDADDHEVYEGDTIQTPDGKCYFIEDLNLAQMDFIARCKLKKE